MSKENVCVCVCVCTCMTETDLGTCEEFIVLFVSLKNSRGQPGHKCSIEWIRLACASSARLQLCVCFK